MKIARGLLIGLLLGLPATAWSGGDVCPQGAVHYDLLRLELSALVIDGTDQGIAMPPPTGNITSSSSDTAGAQLPTPWDPGVASRIIYFRRTP